MSVMLARPLPHRESAFVMPKKGGRMMRNRKKQRELKKEEKLDNRDAYGNRDLTPFNAVARIRGEARLVMK